MISLGPKAVQFRFSFVSDSLHSMDGSPPGFPVHHQLPKLVHSHVHQVSDAIQPSHPLLSPSPPLQSSPESGSFSTSRFFAPGPKCWSFSFSTVLPMNIQDWFPSGLTGLISLQSKGTLKSLHQHYRSEVSILWHSALFMVQFSHPYTITVMNLCQ